MIDEDQDEASYGKILEAAKEIQGMAELRPAEAQTLLAQARHLVELAEQIRHDWLLRNRTARNGWALNLQTTPQTRN